jgi:D-alanine-D-alanine ligase
VKIAVVYNRDSQNVINLFGLPNREKIGLKTISRISEALRAGKHQVKAIEGDKDLIERLEKFMPKVLKAERPGLVFNLSYGIQGQARYTHVPSILEMVGVPYVGSGPLAHGLALDKVVAKMIFRQHDLPTPDFTVLNRWDSQGEIDLPYPLIVKPKTEAVSFGVTIVNNEKELEEAAGRIFEAFQQPVIVERFVEGREINVGLIGNNPAETFPPVELVFGEHGPAIYTYEDKTRQSGREIGFKCPAPVSDEMTEKAQNLARQAFEALGCYDCARVDMRIDEKGDLYILEVNSLPSLGEHGSYTIGAEHVGLDFAGLANRLVEVASSRYFGTPQPPRVNPKDADSGQLIVSFLSQRRDQIEKRLSGWTKLHSRSSDIIGIRGTFRKVGDYIEEAGLTCVEDLSDDPYVRTWESRCGFSGGTLIIGHVDVPVPGDVPVQEFRRTPEWLYGEGIGLSRAPMVMVEFALKALRSLRRLGSLPIGVLYYADEGSDCSHSSKIIQAASSRARQVLVVRPGNPENKVVTQRRGWRKYRLRVEGEPGRLGKNRKKPDVLIWITTKLESLSKLSNKKDRLAIATGNLRTQSYPMFLPHVVEATVMMSYGESAAADKSESMIRGILGKEGFKWDLELLSDRPAMKQRQASRNLAGALSQVASDWEIPFGKESSLWPSVAGLVPPTVGVVCGLGPVARKLHTPQEAVERISILQRTMLLAEFLLRDSRG